MNGDEYSARELLLRYLLPAQRVQFDIGPKQNEWFDVNGSKTNIRYRIYLAGWVIGPTNFAGPIRHVCFRSGIASEGLPYYDQMLAKKIALEMNEPAVLEIAGSLHAPDDVIWHYSNVR